MEGETNALNFCKAVWLSIFLFLQYAHPVFLRQLLSPNAHSCSSATHSSARIPFSTATLYSTSFSLTHLSTDTAPRLSCSEVQSLAKCHVLSSPSLGRVFQPQSPQQQQSFFLKVRLNIAGGDSNSTEGKQTGCCGNYTTASSPVLRHQVEEAQHTQASGASFHPLPVKIYLEKNRLFSVHYFLIVPRAADSNSELICCRNA